MIESKKGSAIRIIAAILGGTLFFTALYFLNQENFFQATVFGMIGVILIAISMLPFTTEPR